MTWLMMFQKTFCADKKDVALYSEKVVNLPFKPSLSQYGGKSIDGFIAVTATGMVKYFCRYNMFCDGFIPVTATGVVKPLSHLRTDAADALSAAIRTISVLYPD